MKLSELCRGIPLATRLGQDVEIASLTCDTRALRPGGLFAALPGTRRDGNDFIPEALEKGAAAVLCAAAPSGDGPWLLADDPRAAYGRLCANWFGRPGDRLRLTGVTGTNGKTTTTYLLKAILEHAGARVGLIGTNQILIGDRARPAERTTPDAYLLQSLLAEMADAGCGHAVMEVSSHALALRRTEGLWYEVGAFTNLTRDHLDFHGTMAAYRAAKARLFDQCAAGLFDLDDPTGRSFAGTVPCERHGFAVDRPAEVRATALRLRPDGTAFTVTGPEERCRVWLPIPGRFAVHDALAALGAARLLGVPLHVGAQALAHVEGVRGRMEVVPVPAPFTVLIDYAHTPDALEKLLGAVRGVTPGRVLCVFGCGGDRDRTKRPIMGELAAELADLVVLTSDNPRSEDPERICDEIAAGFPPGFSDLVREPDRRRAIRRALALARPGDTVVLAGKGHETTQEIAGVRRPLDEREEIASFFAGDVL